MNYTDVTTATLYADKTGDIWSVLGFLFVLALVWLFFREM